MPALSARRTVVAAVVKTRRSLSSLRPPLSPVMHLLVHLACAAVFVLLLHMPHGAEGGYIFPTRRPCFASTGVGAVGKTGLLLFSATRTTTEIPENDNLFAEDKSEELHRQQHEQEENEHHLMMIRFGGVGRLYHEERNDDSSSEQDDEGEVVLERLRRSTVVVIGLGGVGSWAAEALCRSGVGNIRLIDFDDVCISNTNRQLHALANTVGQFKIDAMYNRLLQINPNCNVTLLHDFVTEDNVHSILQSHDKRTTVVLDAMDGSTEKAALYAACADLKLCVVGCGGAAARKDPTKIVCKDLTVVKDDNLLRSARKEMRKKYGFNAGEPFLSRKKTRKWKIDCVYSEELLPSDERRAAAATTTKGADSGGSESMSVTTSNMRVCDGSMGTACFVTGTFGFVAAGKIVDKIVSNRMKPPSRGYWRQPPQAATPESATTITEVKKIIEAAGNDDDVR